MHNQPGVPAKQLRTWQFSLNSLFALTALVALHCWLAIEGGIVVLGCGILWTVTLGALYYGWRWAFFGWPRDAWGLVLAIFLTIGVLFLMGMALAPLTVWSIRVLFLPR